MYTIICRYQIDGVYIEFDIDKMFKRLSIPPYTELLILYNIEHGYKVQYLIKKKNRYSRVNFSMFNRDKMQDLKSMVDYLNNRHDYYIEHMNENDFKKIFNQYGNNYTISNNLSNRSNTYHE